MVPIKSKKSRPSSEPILEQVNALLVKAYQRAKVSHRHPRTEAMALMALEFEQRPLTGSHQRALMYGVASRLVQLEAEEWLSADDRLDEPGFPERGYDAWLRSLQQRTEEFFSIVGCFLTPPKGSMAHLREEATMVWVEHAKSPAFKRLEGEFRQRAFAAAAKDMAAAAAKWVVLDDSPIQHKGFLRWLKHYPMLLADSIQRQMSVDLWAHRRTFEKES